ncbi:hypothetical protein EBT16_12335 [bacterium]|nr:hypothetical protein [bacterium]
MSENTPRSVRVAIVGSGPAGWTAAVYAASQTGHCPALIMSNPTPKKICPKRFLKSALKFLCRDGLRFLRPIV